MKIRNSFLYLRPSSIKQVYEYLQTRENATILAGGTDLVPLMKYGLKNPGYLLALDQN